MKTKKKLVWQLFFPYLSVILVALIATTWYASKAMRQFHLEQTRIDLENRAYLTKEQIVKLFNLPDKTSLNRYCKSVGRRTSTRITVILPSGKVVSDSFENAEAMENHSDRPEIIEAFTGKVGSAVRYSETLTKTMMYVAIPINPSGPVEAVLRTSVPLTAIEQSLLSIRVELVIWGVVMALLAAAISFWVARRISAPIRRLRNGAEHFAQGDFSKRLPVPESEEIAALTRAMNDMAEHLSLRITTITDQRNKLEAVLSSMLEGVVAVDPKGNIVQLNKAAAEIFDTSPELAVNKSFMEMSRNHQLQNFVQQAVSGQNPISSDIVFFKRPEDHFYNVHSTPIIDEANNRSGTLIVFNDVTTLKRLENIRQDFVANVSHEIKTPLTAIKGFVETLRYGAMENVDENRRFLEIIERHVNRLNAIIEDLLVLSRLEQQDEKNEIELNSTPVKNILLTAAQVCQSSADEKKIALEINCPANLVVEIDETLMEQALINLIDNAVKYSPKERPVIINAALTEKMVIITIKDHGAGIPKKHIPRIFERFYRVDKARSRDMGGTGLGLAIVKHIINSHGGQIRVESTLGEGSTFTVQLPLPNTSRS